MKKIAFLSEKNSPRVGQLHDILAKEYEVIFLYSKNEVMSLLEKSFDNISVLIVDDPSSKEYINEVFEYIKERNNYMFSLPVLVLTDFENMEVNDNYLVNPVVDILFPDDSDKIALCRVKNAVTLANSTSFEAFSEMLTELPVLVYLKDKEGKYAFASQQWHHLTPNLSSIRGLTDFQIRRDKRNAEIARAADQEVVRTGKGKTYIIREEDEDGIDYLQVIKQPLKKNGDVYGIIAIINNVTNQELLRQELLFKSITDQLTGLYNRSYFEEYIELIGKELKYPVTIISADCDELKQINDNFGHAAGDQYICYARDVLKSALPNNTVIFRMGGDEFLAVVPETDEAKAQEYVDKINKSIVNYKNDNFCLSLSVGSHTINDENCSVENGVKLSDKEMYKVKNFRKKKSF